MAVLLIRKLLVRREDLEVQEKDDANKTYIAAFQVHNPAIFNKSIKDIAHMSYPKFVISRLWRDGNVSIPTSEKIIKEGDRLLVVTSEKDALALTVLFGEQENTDWNKEDIDWNAIDSQLISQRIVVTRPELNGKKLGSFKLLMAFPSTFSTFWMAAASPTTVRRSPNCKVSSGVANNCTPER